MPHLRYHTINLVHHQLNLPWRTSHLPQSYANRPLIHHLLSSGSRILSLHWPQTYTTKCDKPTLPPTQFRKPHTKKVSTSNLHYHTINLVYHQFSLGSHVSMYLPPYDKPGFPPTLFWEPHVTDCIGLKHTTHDKPFKKQKNYDIKKQNNTPPKKNTLMQRLKVEWSTDTCYGKTLFKHFLGKMSRPKSTQVTINDPNLHSCWNPT